VLVETDLSSPRFQWSGFDSPEGVPEALSAQSNYISSTAQEHRRAVERVITAMQQRLDEPWSLHSMAEVAQYSPCYFNRIFHQVTNLPPGRFLAAIRMEAAKRLLLTTSLSVTDVCFEVGYQSLGSFTRDFSHSVGLPPRILRRLSGAGFVPPSYLTPPISPPRPTAGAHRQGATIRGRIISDTQAGLVFIGIFSTSLPQGAPLRCALLDSPPSPATYYITDAPDGLFYIFAAAFPPSQDPSTYLLPDSTQMRVGATQSPLLIRDGKITGQYIGGDIVLRRPQVTNPPILIALPFLMIKHQAAIAAREA